MRIILALILTVFGWGSSFIGIRLGVESYSPEIVTFARYLIAALLAIIIYAYVPNKVRLSWIDTIRCLSCGMLGMGFYSYSLAVGEQTVPASLAGFIVGMMPLCASVLATFLYKEQISRRLWVGIGLSISGLLIIALSSREASSFGNGLIWLFCCTICGTAYTLLQKPLIKKMPPGQFICYALWGAAAFLGGIYLLSGVSFIDEFQDAKLISTLSIVYQGVVPSIFAFFGWSYALSKINIAKASLALYAMPLVSAFLAWLILAEKPTSIALIGMGLAFSGSLVGSLKLRKKQKATI